MRPRLGARVTRKDRVGRLPKTKAVIYLGGKMKPKLLVIGHARHGKDSVCNILRDNYGFTFISSSYFVMERAVQPFLQKSYGLSYPTPADCYADRVNHRSKWYDAIRLYNRGDEARLGRELFQNYSIYCGLRSPVEFYALKTEKAFDASIWVDASLRVDPEPLSSNKLTSADADYVLNNNGTVEDLESEVARVMKFIRVSFPE